MGQQPNIELEISDLPRPRPKPSPARGWIPGRPGELGGPEDMQWGDGFGTTGPDAGYAQTLVAGREINLGAGEHRANVNIALAAVASARASVFGRAPTMQDIDLALVLLGYDSADIPDEIAADLADRRPGWFAAVGHHPEKLSDLMGHIPTDVLRLTAAEARNRMAQAEELITR